MVGTGVTTIPQQSRPRGTRRHSSDALAIYHQLRTSVPDPVNLPPRQAKRIEQALVRLDASSSKTSTLQFASGEGTIRGTADDRGDSTPTKSDRWRKRRLNNSGTVSKKDLINITRMIVMVNAFKRVGHQANNAEARERPPGEVGSRDESAIEGQLSTDAPSSLDNFCAPPLPIMSSEADGLWYKGFSLSGDAAAAAVVGDTNLGILGVDGEDSFSIRRRWKARVMSDEARNTSCGAEVRNSASSSSGSGDDGDGNGGKCSANGLDVTHLLGDLTKVDKNLTALREGAGQVVPRDSPLRGPVAMARINAIIGALAERKEAGAGVAPEGGGGEAGGDDDSPGSSSSLSDSAIEAVIGFVDVDRSGEVDAKELEVAISAAKQGKLSDPQLEGYMLKIDDELRLKHLRIVDVFKKMDMDGSGTLSHHELAEGLHELCSQDRVKILQRREELRQRKRRLHEEEERKRAELVGFMTNLESLPATMLEDREYFATDITDNDALQALVKTLSEGDNGTDGSGDGDGNDRGGEHDDKDKDKGKDTYEGNGNVQSAADSSVHPLRTGRPAVALPGASNGSTNGNIVGCDNGKHGNQQQAMKHEKEEYGKTFTGENGQGDRKVGLINKATTSDPATESQSIPSDRPRGTSDTLSVAGSEVVHPAQFRKRTKEVDAQLDQLRDAVFMRRSARVVLAQIGRHGHGGAVERTTTREPVRGGVKVGEDDLAAAAVRQGEEDDDRDAHGVENAADGTSAGFIRADAHVAPPGDPTVGDDDGATTEQGEDVPITATAEAGISNVMRARPNNRRRCIVAKRRRDQVEISATGALGSKSVFLSRGDDVIERQKKSDLNDPVLRVFLQRQFESERLPFLFAARSASRFHGYTVNDALEMVKRQAGRIPPLA